MAFETGVDGVRLVQEPGLIAPNSPVLGGGALALSATDGFLYIPTCAGTPTGVPTASSGSVPLVYDTTGQKLWMYTAGAWVPLAFGLSGDATLLKLGSATELDITDRDGAEVVKFTGRVADPMALPEMTLDTVLKSNQDASFRSTNPATNAPLVLGASGPGAAVGLIITTDTGNNNLGLLVEDSNHIAQLSDGGNGTDPAAKLQVGAGFPEVDLVDKNAAPVVAVQVGKLGFFAATPVVKQTVTGSRLSGAALVSLLAALVNLGLITDSTST